MALCIKYAARTLGILRVMRARTWMRCGSEASRLESEPKRDRARQKEARPTGGKNKNAVCGGVLR